MQMEPSHLRLCHAPRGGDGRAYERFFAFLTGINDPHVHLRPEEVVRAVIEEQNLFFVEKSDGTVIGTTGFYRHGAFPNLWAEIGSTLIHPLYRGFGLQHEWLASQVFDPVIAVVDLDATASSANIAQCGFKRLATAPKKLMEAKPQYDWSVVGANQQLLYQLEQEGVAAALSFVAQRGAEQRLLNKRTGVHLSLHVEFAYLTQPGVLKELQLEAIRVLNLPDKGFSTGMPKEMKR